ncbi:hypothetical protein Ancab_035051 [Ancistrocladus abbreviatus]
MADIAMLVAEEYEKIVKRTSRKSNSETGQMDSTSCKVVLAERFRKLNWVSREVGEHSMEFVRKALQPKSELGFAAISGFFSA